MVENQQEISSNDEKIQKIRSKATELLLREDWNESIRAYTQYITLCNQQTHQESNPDRLLKHRKSICLALSNRAEARVRLKEYEQALSDCEEALRVDKLHFKSLICKGKILLNLNKYKLALDCFKKGLSCDHNGNLEMVNGLIEKCKKLDYLSKSGNFDVTDWVLSGFDGKYPELSEFIGNVEIKKSEISGRGLFSTKNLDVGSLILVTKGVAIERCVLPNKGLGENEQLGMWKNFIDKVSETVNKCGRVRHLIGKLSIGEDEDDLEVPEIGLFKGEIMIGDENVEMGRVLSVLDVNSLVEDAVSSKVLGKNRDYYGVGLWLLPSLINHSCLPNVRRLHIGDYVLVLASREIKAGEEMTFAYYDVLSPLNKRKQMAKSWGFNCRCKRCKQEEQIQLKPEFSDIELGLEKEVDRGCTIFRLEECMRKCVVRGKEKGYLRASFWKAFSEAYESEKTVRRWGRKIPALEGVIESLVEAVGSEERVVKVLVRKMKKSGGGFGEIEKAMKLGRGVYGKVMKKQALRILLELGAHQ